MAEALSVSLGMLEDDLQRQLQVAAHFAFKGPPEEQRDMQVIVILAVQQQFPKDRKRIPGREPLAGAGQLAANLHLSFRTR